MSDVLAALRFYPWVRRGAAATLTTPDADTAPARATMEATVGFNEPAANLTASTTIELLGPGDIVGFDARSISRRSPPARTLDAEPNYFPAIEFDQADLPWRYTPTGEDAAGRVRPWLCLLAFTEAELGPFVATSTGRSLESVTVKVGAPMPSPEQLWAWAHVQVSGDDELPLLDVVTRAPHRCLSRLLCPRRLDPRTKYWVLLVPTFEVGRLAGLRSSLTSATDTLAPAWSETTLMAPLELPIYHRWSFSTGFDGDFESLVRRLEAAPLPATVGTRGLDVAQPGGGLPAPSDEPLPLGGALRPPGTPSPPPPIASEFTDALTNLLNTPAKVREDGGTSVVAPPLYGAWHARREILDGDAPDWFAALNERPESRVAAAAGTAVVQKEQEDLMASAWEQVAGIREANQQLRMAQVARAVGERLYARHVVAADDAGALTLTASVHAQIRGATRTARTTIDRSPTRHALIATGMRRLARPLGPVGRRQARPDATGPSTFERVNSGTLGVLAEEPPPLHPTNVPTFGWFENVASRSFPTWLEVEEAPIADKVYAWDPVDGVAPDRWDTGAGTDSPSMAAFRAAAKELLSRELTHDKGTELTRLDLPALRTLVQTALDPRTTIVQGFGVRLQLAADFEWSPPDPLEPVMAHPEFPQPMFRPLAAQSPDWILPGLFDVPADRVTLAAVNQPFIEAYMVGLNHELARELLWREYPSDQRGSYFRQFWEPAGAMPAPESAKDVTPVHGWGSSELGEHCPRVTAGNELVLVVRSEVLRRYPGTLVYAQRAVLTSGALGLAAADQQRRPVFSARVEPDVALFGFSLTAEEVRGDVGAGDPGWFFVFEEQPGDPRFGLDTGATGAPSDWDDLAWEHLVTSPTPVTEISYVDLDRVEPATAALETPTGPVWHATPAAPGGRAARGADHAAITLQRPARVALHGADLLP